uniref:ATP synthase F0 subunit 8 n=1 Tax=Aleuroglyphus ovatus TaxID=212130 RepID=A0A023HKA6_ALEOV|nr:ATP synthase F0 subunit 8 [Aleuroglyphus ovatus]AGM14586.1 ATP synthase F0 subunit 8 [Aleuroglyphus ovatus]AID52411.1 ATP synthase F0 subunit 8 [Aleuroglyphus ovatus]QWW33384.1 ATP synthase F0 subunit 8 [Aleuroglyphus ovatus]
MLPQMMPLPWVMVFFLIFFCVYSVSLFISSWMFFSFDSLDKKLKSSFVALPW